MKFELQGEFRPSSVVFGVFVFFADLALFFGTSRGCVTIFVTMLRFSEFSRDERLRDDLRGNVAIFGTSARARAWDWIAGSETDADVWSVTLTVGTVFRVRRLGI